MGIMAEKLVDPGRLPGEELHQARAGPLSTALGWEYDSAIITRPMQKALEATDIRKLREEQKEKQEAFKRGETRELMGIGVSGPLHRTAAPARRRTATLRHRAERSHPPRPRPPHRAGDRADGERSQGQGHETTWQIIASEHRHPRRQHRGSRRAIPTPPPTASATTGSALDPGGGRRDRHGGAQDQGQGADDRGLHAGGARGSAPRMGRLRSPVRQFGKAFRR